MATGAALDREFLVRIQAGQLGACDGKWHTSDAQNVWLAGSNPATHAQCAVARSGRASVCTRLVEGSKPSCATLPLSSSGQDGALSRRLRGFEPRRGHAWPVGLVGQGRLVLSQEDAGSHPAQVTRLAARRASRCTGERAAWRRQLFRKQKWVSDPGLTGFDSSALRAQEIPGPCNSAAE